jgi:hypothetical protein
MRTLSMIRETKEEIFSQMKNIKIRKETLQDIDTIGTTNEQAFGQSQDANIHD